MISEAAAPRPNVASGGVAGLVTALIVLLVQVQQGQAVALETWVASLVPLAGAIVAYYLPAYSKTFGWSAGRCRPRYPSSPRDQPPARRGSGHGPPNLFTLRYHHDPGHGHRTEHQDELSNL